ncbi:MAG: hypothetical protein ACC628_18270 [Pirellulaceae bacterium]
MELKARTKIGMLPETDDKGPFAGCPLRVRFLLLALVLCNVAAVHAPPARAARDENSRFERFLARLGLVDLQITHLEQVLDRETNEKQRTETARHLADLYAGRLIASAEDTNKYRDLEQRIQRLIDRIPEASTPSLEVMLLQADYLRAEQLVGKWIASPTDTVSRDAAAKILIRIAPQLDRLQRELRAVVDALLEEVDSMDASDERDAKENELLRLQSVAGRAAYFAAWSNYYLGRANPHLPDVKKTFTRARDIFRQLLGLGDGEDDVEPELLGLELIWRARSMIGLALSEAAVGNLDESLACFGYLEHASVPAEVRDQAPYWRLESLLAAQQFDAAFEYAKQRVGEASNKPTQGKISFFVHLVRAAYANPDAAPPNANEMGTLGIAGLVKLRQLNVVKKLIEKYRIPLDAGNGFYLQWIQGQRLLEVAERSTSREDFGAAAARLSAALQSPDADQDLGAAAQCRYQLGWCLYHLEKYEEAARAYEGAISGLQAVGDDTAVQAAWAAFLAYRKLVASQPRFVSSAIDLLNRLKREFPDHEYARRADYQIGKLREGAVSTAETLDRLQHVPAGSTDYLDARYDIGLLTYKQWTTADDKKAAADRVYREVDTYLAAAAGKADPSRSLKGCLLAAEVALSDTDRDAGKLERYLRKAQPWADSPSVQGSLAAEYHYRRLQQATAANDETARRRHAAWLVEKAPGSAYELPALVIAAKAVDSAVTRAGDSTPTTLWEEAYRIYNRLADLLGSSSEIMAEKKNARVANSKLAHYATLLGRFDDAGQRLVKILAAFPNDKGYLRRAGLAFYRAGSYEQALDPWRTLVAGLPKGSDGWYEAKYYQLACLFQIDSQRARDTLNQFQLLYPNPPANWQKMFRQLEKR